jgi:hypothetical protein
MKNFKKINDLPIYDLTEDLSKLLSENKIDFLTSNQICLTTTKDCPDDFRLGSGSLVYDWVNVTEIKNADGTIETVPTKREVPLKEEDFSVLCSQFKGTKFEEIYNIISKKYKLGRVRIMKMDMRYVMTWHTDTSPRLHYPIKTQTGCFMIIDNEFMHIPQNEWWITNTEKVHTALNASKISRIHLVATVLGPWS